MRPGLPKVTQRVRELVAKPILKTTSLTFLHVALALETHKLLKPIRLLIF